MDEEKQEESHYTEDPFSRMMFGSRANVTENVNQNDHQQNSSIDFDELMTNIDNLVESARGLKPLFHKIYPIIEQLWKKD
jgi:hypothetical protein